MNVKLDSDKLNLPMVITFKKTIPKIEIRETHSIIIQII
jgi:hypothetical protein